jgi:hypothetical protein
MVAGQKHIVFICYMYRQYADSLSYMKLLVIPIQLLILITNIPMLLSTLKYSLTMLDSLLVVSCVNRFSHKHFVTINSSSIYPSWYSDKLHTGTAGTKHKNTVFEIFSLYIFVFYFSEILQEVNFCTEDLSIFLKGVLPWIFLYLIFSTALSASPQIPSDSTVLEDASHRQSDALKTLNAWLNLIHFLLGILIIMEYNL